MKLIIGSTSARIILILSISIIININSYAESPNISPRHQVKDNVAVYLGVIPAEIIEGHTAHSMHGGLPTGDYRYHIAVALFDDATGKRIKTANVKAIISNQSNVGIKTQTTLEEMEINEKIMFGNYITLKTTGPYQIIVTVQIGHRNKPVTFTFNLDMAHS